MSPETAVNRVPPPPSFSRFFRPVLLRSSIRLERPASWLELFFDLICVAAISQLAAPLASDYSFAGLMKFVFFFMILWWAWFDHTLFCSRFHVNDTLQNVMTLAQVFVVAVMAANAKAPSSSHDAAGFGAAYGVMCLILLCQYLRARHSLSDKHSVNSQSVCLAISFAKTQAKLSKQRYTPQHI